MKKLIFASLFAAVFAFAAEKEVQLTIKGMTCQMCAGSVKETLMKTDGVKDAKIYLKDEKAVVKTEKDIDINALNAKLKPHGYSAQLR
ncbi:MAG TPA: cation transporter [Campylobacterales bacterium]|nr:cation transporter [Campylobacterales bacterium]